MGQLLSGPHVFIKTKNPHAQRPIGMHLHIGPSVHAVLRVFGFTFLDTKGRTTRAYNDLPGLSTGLLGGLTGVIDVLMA